MQALNIFKSRNGRIYCGLIVLRVLFASVGLGYIHPDEYFQNGEVTVGAVFKWHSLRTWEWDPVLPCRSILPPFLTTGLPLAILSVLFSGNVSGRLVFLVERLSTLVLSFLLVPFSRAKALLLLASSHVVMTFQVRPFSNSIEACLVASALAVLGNMLANKPDNHGAQIASWLALILVVGIMTRITFPVFVLPVAIQVLLFSIRTSKASGHFTFNRWARFLAVPFCVGSATLCGAIAMDSFYFSGGINKVVVTPYNNLVYNLSADNLAKHGLHPRWLHAVVNMPLIVGPALVIYGALAARKVATQYQADKSRSPLSVINRTCIWIILLSVAVLSLQPHQEPRFLTPLVVPFIVLVVNNGYLENASKIFWATWFVGNAVLSVVFGVLHQGAVVPSLLHLNNLISANNSSGDYAVVYWKTYMPPWHLLGIPENQIITGHASVADLAGKPSSDVEDYLISLRGQHPEGTTLYLVAPEFAMQSLEQPIAKCFRIDRQIYPHIDLDHISESIETGWPGGVCLGVYVADLDCVASSIPLW
ncbi:Alg9-like mannosyltransferase family-domain-containing protein [Irpex rosettiformis]|uniref:Alg9-like mannosyltransferase family-domain-containing protein n=1 Tax=Irpex rosettiformis TaxID=378272 RepID=A0ACB8U201_9APHY|nr:Alg9-like mannosyltransferase family-domain-containing protein [Irpex rosettiformis]